MTRDRACIYCPYVAADANSTICSIRYSIPKQTKTSFLTLETNHSKIMGLADPEIITVVQLMTAISCHGDSSLTGNDRLWHHCLHSSLQAHPLQRMALQPSSLPLPPAASHVTSAHLQHQLAVQPAQLGQLVAKLTQGWSQYFRVESSQQFISMDSPCFDTKAYILQCAIGEAKVMLYFQHSRKIILFS